MPCTESIWPATCFKCVYAFTRKGGCVLCLYVCVWFVLMCVGCMTICICTLHKKHARHIRIRSNIHFVLRKDAREQHSELLFRACCSANRNVRFVWRWLWVCWVSCRWPPQQTLSFVAQASGRWGCCWGCWIYSQRSIHKYLSYGRWTRWVRCCCCCCCCLRGTAKATKGHTVIISFISARTYTYYTGNRRQQRRRERVNWF